MPDSPQQTGPHDRFVQVRCRGSHSQWNRHRIASSFHATVTPPPGPRHAPAERQTSATVTAAHPLRKAGDRRPFLPTRPASGDTAASAKHNARSKAGCTRRRSTSTIGPRQWEKNAQHPESAANRQNPALLFRRRYYDRKTKGHAELALQAAGILDTHEGGEARGLPLRLIPGSGYSGTGSGGTPASRTTAFTTCAIPLPVTRS